MKIAILDSLTLGEVDLKRFEDFGDVQIYPTTSKEQVFERCIDTEIIITCKVRFDKEMLCSLPNTKLIALTSTGMDNIDLETAQELGIEVKNVVGYSTNAVAQHTLMFALSLMANLPHYDSYCKNGGWCQSPIFTYVTNNLFELEGKEWGIIGFGNIGKQVAKLAQTFGAKVSYASTSGKNSDLNYPKKSLESLLQTSDIISIHAPLNPKTYHLINQEKLSLLKSKAILINVGRGGIIDEEALTQKMLNSEIKFASDVLENEPMKDNHPLLHPNLKDRLLLTPHTAWAYQETRERLIEKVYENIKAFLEK